MRRFAALFLLSLLPDAAAAFDAFAAPVTVRSDRRPLGEVLSEIGQKTRVRFAAPKAVADGTATLFVETVPLRELLQLLKEAYDLGFECDGTNCRVSPGEKTEAALAPGKAAGKGGRCRRARESRPVSVVCRNAPLGAFLAEVSSQAPFNVILTKDLPARRVTLELKDASVEDALRPVAFAKDLSYQRVGRSKTYLISPRPPAPKRKAKRRS